MMGSGYLQDVIDSTRAVLHPRGRLAAFLVVAAATLSLFILIPVRTIPGNDLLFQLRLFGSKDYALLILLSSLNALLAIMHYHVFRAGRDDGPGRLGALAASSGGGLSAAFASVLGTASCSSCVAGFLGFLGTGGVLFMLNYRSYFVAGAIAVVVFAILRVSRTISRGCAVCRVPRPSA